MKRNTFGAWFIMFLGAVYFIVPLIGTFEFSLRLRREGYSLEAYQNVVNDPRFIASFGYSLLIALAVIIVGILIVVPTAYWVQLRLPQLRGLVEFVTLLPLVIPAIVLVFGLLRIYGRYAIRVAEFQFLGLDVDVQTSDLFLMFGYVVLALPYLYRAVDTGLRSIDVRTLTEAAQSLGASWGTILFRVILPNIRVGILSGAFLSLAIVVGEFTMASLWNRPAFGVYMQNIGANRAYEPAALAIVSFALTWSSIGLIQFLGRGAPGQTPVSGGR